MTTNQRLQLTTMRWVLGAAVIAGVSLALLGCQTPGDSFDHTGIVTPADYQALRFTDLPPAEPVLVVVNPGPIRIAPRTADLRGDE